MSHEEQYTDYSCSTSVERLTRDVEDQLRSWHLSGSDRHVSFQHQPERGRSPGSVFRQPKKQQAPKQQQSVQLLRTQEVEWVVPTANNNNDRMTMTLRLDLWDSPTAITGENNNLPLSLQRTAIKIMPVNVFVNLSTIFGIGQHITLSLASASAAENVMTAMGRSVVERHSQKMAPTVVISSLSAMLQTALQIAISNIRCNIPAFGIWGTYDASAGQDDTAATRLRLLPTWIQDCSELPFRKRTSLFLSSKHQLNQSYCPPLMVSNMLTGQTQFWVCIAKGDSSSRLTELSQILLQHCDTPTVVLCGAKQIYSWRKPLPKSRNRQPLNEWRQGRPEVVLIYGETSIKSYQDKCRHYAASLMDRFSGASLSNPLWGPLDDPVQVVHVTVTWDPKRDDDDKAMPLLTLPLKVRSKQEMSQSDLVDMEESVERAILNPFAPASFLVGIHYDAEAPLARLASTQRLLLASLIRTTTLPETTLLHQLTDEMEMDEFSSEDIEGSVAKLANRAGVGPVTRSLINAVDWKTHGDEMIEGWEAEKIVQKIMDVNLGFPSPPDAAFFRPKKSAPRDLFAALPQSAPAGRLLSNLFVHMSRLRSPASMALVWTYFVHDLRNRFYSRTSLPNMGYVPGIDPALGEMMNEKICFSTSGLRLKAENAAFVHCSEPQPDAQHCLIGQKLQVFNICIESLVATEIHNATNMERSFEDGEEEEVLMMSDDGRLAQSGGEGIVDQQPNSDARSVCTVDTHASRFFDADDGGSTDGDMLFTPQDDKPPCTRQGARCPVFGVNLENGDQLYAPYLLRPIPWTDDVILERHCMLTAKSSRSFRSVDRLEILNRFLKPELLSDMRSFQSANAGATYDDFVKWYGEPGNALQEFDEIANSADLPVAIKLDKAAEVIKIMTKTRKFWKATWEEAVPAPAISQPPLFDVLSTVEMVLDFCENLHPASLLNQIMAVNLSVSYFALVNGAAEEAMSVICVKDSLTLLRRKTELALDLLARDAKHATRDAAAASPEQLPRHASLEAIRAVEDACNALSDAEALLSRATSLLHKFPEQYEFVQLLLTRRANHDIPLDDLEGRQGILNNILKQQHSTNAANNTGLPTPSRRAYILRNTDEEHPCQLSVRCGEDGTFYQEEEGGMLLALTKTTTKN